MVTAKKISVSFMVAIFCSSALSLSGCAYQIVAAENHSYTGKGKTTLENGEIYVGDFVVGKRNGRGKYTWANGSTYEGDFVENQRTGQGKFKWPSGAIYEGSFLNGWITGKGKMTGANGDTYEGYFENDQMTGRGIKILRRPANKYESKIFEGDFVNGKLNGYGKETSEAGYILEGTFSDGRLINGTYSKGDKVLITYVNGQSHPTPREKHEPSVLGNIFNAIVQAAPQIAIAAQRDPIKQADMVQAQAASVQRQIEAEKLEADSSENHFKVRMSEEYWKGFKEAEQWSASHPRNPSKCIYASDYYLVIRNVCDYEVNLMFVDLSGHPDSGKIIPVFLGSEIAIPSHHIYWRVCEAPLKPQPDGACRQ